MYRYRFAFVGVAALMIISGLPQGSGVVYEMRGSTYDAGACGDDREPAPCTRVELAWPMITSVPSGEAMASINGFVRTWLARPVFEDDGGSAEEIGAALERAHDQLRRDFPDYDLPWHVERSVRVAHQSPGVFSIALAEDRFTGGAHGAHALLYRNFRPADGSLIERDDILVDNGLEELTRIAEAIFRRERELAPDASLEEAGYWVENGRFALNDNFLIDADGLRFHYNEYEIAPYAYGATELLIPYASIGHLLRPDAGIR